MSRVTVKRFEKMSIKTILALTKKNAVHGRKIRSVDFFKLCNNPTKPTPNSLHYTPRQYTLLLILIRNSSNSRKMTTFSVKKIIWFSTCLPWNYWIDSSLHYKQVFRAAWYSKDWSTEDCIMESLINKIWIHRSLVWCSQEQPSKYTKLSISVLGFLGFATNL